MKSYLVNLKVGSDVAGAAALYIDAVVNVSTGAMNGDGTITQALPSPIGAITINHLNGRVVNLAAPPGSSKIVTLQGEYLYSLPPPAIGTVTEQVEVTLQVDAQWNGHGSFTYGGRRVDNVPVKNIAPAATSALVKAAANLDSAGAIRVHNTGAFVMFFTVQGGGQFTADSGSNYANGQSQTINVSPPIPAGAEMWPVADIALGPNSHPAGQNVICDPTSTMTAVYNCGGTTLFPSFSYQGLSSD